MEKNRSELKKSQLNVIENVIQTLESHQSEFLKPRENEDNTGWLDLLPYELLKSFSLLVDKLGNWINPFRRGSQGMGGEIYVDVNDNQMEQFIERIGQVKAWKEKKRIITLNAEPHTKGVEHYKWTTTDKELVQSFLDRFLISPSDTLAKYYIKNEKKNCFAVISEKAASIMDSQKLEAVCGCIGWDYWGSDINIYSSRVMFGKYTRPGTITSECIQKVNGTKKTRNAIGHFSIHYYKGVYPNSKMGWLKFSCKYFTSLPFFFI
eukprot:TRINITY_DN286_c1_g1_i1.p1 TRINITY_DN286_c1_g1~~TRINITY_DN286_c1_g1_i1.p1  ORF type:complete len:290 (-),score=59.52 TRINITY_DN286_c1_g1_i1:123-914(-)